MAITYSNSSTAILVNCKPDLNPRPNTAPVLTSRRTARPSEESLPLKIRRRSRLSSRRARAAAWVAAAVVPVLACGAADFFPTVADPGLQSALDAAVQRVLTRFAPENLTSNQFAVTFGQITDRGVLRRASYRGHVQIYPASVVKLFYLAAAQHWLEQKQLRETDELKRALRDMIVDSSNEATHYVVDLLTDTTSGPELPAAELELWYTKRNAVNRYFQSLGYPGINVNRKPWCEGPYGRESQSIKLHAPNHRNWLTSDATARLLAEIADGRSVSRERSQAMMRLLERRPFDPANQDAQATGFMARGLPPGTRMWSKAGWTSETRHDAAYLELPDGRRVVLVIFTVQHAAQTQILPGIAREILEPALAH